MSAKRPLRATQASKYYYTSVTSSIYFKQNENLVILVQEPKGPNWVELSHRIHEPKLPEGTGSRRKSSRTSGAEGISQEGPRKTNKWKIRLINHWVHIVQTI